ncbi:MAG: heme ABC exporter ATP-binding protein CcmA [Emcibacteraceae bacterium]
MNKTQTFSVVNLTVNRGDRLVFRDLEFTIKPGTLLKLIGPNGSGKSTLLKTLSGLIEAKSGDICSDESSVQGDHEWISRHVCYLGHKNALKREFTVLENIEFWARLWNNQQSVSPAIEKMGISHLRDTPVRYLSSGQARRTALARSMCHAGKIWLFDEPTVGLDDQGLKLLSKTMKLHLDDGGMIICATHVDLGIHSEDTNILNLADYSVSASQFMEQW